ncbi:Hypothetical protein CINCED_3A012395 [Cinara cedri]|uniref:Uncharacterized protein n=1 Tax=Cinara cedri TaxID=506608 RepID=A0A5E4N2Y0_9HEMI|nr:Hypothetical protein CINCED_3A012395 [Cinara cedri]
MSTWFGFGAMVLDTAMSATRASTSPARCGDAEQKEADCLFLLQKCVACDHTSLKTKPHKLGSIASQINGLTQLMKRIEYLNMKLMYTNMNIYFNKTCKKSKPRKEQMQYG